ncbi:hypothetical protein NPIL_583821 [Nephila pilipes]|uniref:Uncharacterized protein n=1 Tax=Nephila pilipes TaxID=299642 RepID=A0A8X6TC14_NEPPI|nr:hypothetical protein NPIL_583821 [Nephila pilipes]
MRNMVYRYGLAVQRLCIVHEQHAGKSMATRTVARLRCDFEIDSERPARFPAWEDGGSMVKWLDLNPAIRVQISVEPLRFALADRFKS